ncbi:MAG: protein kinase [Gemmatimonadales bacterium]
MSLTDPTFAGALADRYTIERELGRGGMATVYLARDLRHQRLVALKLLNPDLAEQIGTERFEREIRLAARLQHPHICSVYDSGAVRDQLWFTMPYIEGESLDARLERERQVPVDEALRIAREAARALGYAHEHGVIHRDIKPANLLLAKDGTVLVADFGIARAVASSASAADAKLTQPGFSPGTPAYMSPEQRAGIADVDARSDIFSLGVVLFEMLIGERPFGYGALAAFAMALSDPVPSVRARRGEVPAAVDVVLKRALATDPAQRYATMAELGEDLDRLRRGVPPAAGGGARAGGWRRWLLPAGLGLVVLAAGAIAIRSRFSAAPASRSTAVLPFRDLSPEHTDAYFSEGLAEELTTTLAKIPGLRVAARSSAFQFRDAAVDVREVGRKLDVGTVLEGSVRRSGTRIKVSAQLVSARDGYELWSESYDREQGDVFQVQEEIARAIGAALRVRLASAADSALRQRPTEDLEAYDLYLRGRFAINQRTEATIPEAIRLFEAAVARDSDMARAWAGLADARLLLPLYSSVADPKQSWAAARSAALRAIALDSTSAEAYTSLAYGTMLNEWDWARADSIFRKALAADSTYPTAHHWYGDYLAGRNRLPEALAQMQLARRYDPLSRIIATELGWTYNSLGRQAEADSVLGEVLKLDPNFSQALFVVAQVRLEQKRYAEALDLIRRSLAGGGSTSQGYGVLITALARSGDLRGARAMLDSLTRLARTTYVPPFTFVMAYANLGDFDRAFAMLEKGIAERDILLPENFFEPLFDPLKPDPRYPGIVQRLGGVMPPRTPPSRSTPPARGG